MQIDRLRAIGRWDEDYQRPKIQNKIPMHILHTLNKELILTQQKLSNDKFNDKLKIYINEAKYHTEYYYQWNFYDKQTW